MPKMFRVMNKGSTKLLLSMRDEEEFIVVETMIRIFVSWVGGVTMVEGMPKLGVEVLAIIIIPLVHGVGPKILGEGGGSGGVGVGLKGSLPNDRRKAHVLDGGKL